VYGLLDEDSITKYQPTKLSLGPQQSYKEHRFPRAIYILGGNKLQLQSVFFNNQLQIVEGNDKKKTDTPLQQLY
jgi:hypothetical protein